MGMWDDAQAQGIPSASKQVETSLAKLAPYATTLTTRTNLGQYSDFKDPTKTGGNGTIFDQLGKWAGDFGIQVGSIVGGAVEGLFNSAIDTVEAPFKLVGNLGNELNINSKIDANNRQIDYLSKKVQSLAADFRAGRLSREQYQEALKGLNDDYDNVYKDAQQNLQGAQDNASDTLHNFIVTASDVVAVVTAGTSTGLTALAVDGAKTVGDGSAAHVIRFFSEKEVSAQMFNAASKIDDITTAAINSVNKVTTFNGRFTSGVVAKITHDTATSGAEGLTAGQIAKNVSVNLLLKRPLIYQTNIDLAAGIYKDIEKGDLTGAALGTILTASMALSGGPIGYAIESLGKSGARFKAMMFPRGAAADFMKAENRIVEASGEGQKFSDEIIENAAKQGVSRDSLDDVLSTFVGTGERSQGVMTLATLAKQGESDLIEFWKVLTETNMRMAGGNAVVAAGLIRDFFNSLDGGRWLKNASYEDVIRHGAQWAADREAAIRDAIANGMKESDALRIVIGRANQSDKELIMDIVAKADEQFGGITREGGTGVDLEKFQQLIDMRLSLFNQAVERYGRTAAWANSDTFIRQVQTVLKNNHDTEEMLRGIQRIKVGKELEGQLSNDVRKNLAKHGHIAIMPRIEQQLHTPYVALDEVAGKKILTETVPAASADGASLFQQAVKPVPVLTQFGAALTRIGLSPEASHDLVQRHFTAGFIQSFNKNVAPLGGQLAGLQGTDVLSKLYSFVREMNNTQKFHFPVTDLRQMTLKEIKSALSDTGLRVTDDEARAIAGSLNSSMLKVPFTIRGLGDKVIDLNYRFNPIAAQFARTQGAVRFVYNPFFRWQQSYQTEGLAQLEVHAATGSYKMAQLPYLNGVNRVLFGNQMREVKSTISFLEDRNIFSQGFTGVGATADIQGQIGTRIIKSEKVSLAGLVNKMAAKQGVSAEEYVLNNEPQVIDMLRTITTSNQTKSTLDSPLVRTINTVFFPFRYNMKVAGLMGEYIGKLNAPTQVAMLSSLMSVTDWLKSDEGITWQQQHANAISLFNWLSPTYPLAYIMKLGQDALDPGNASLGDLGLLGGLPFGMITQFLEGAGVIDISAPYVNPSTGDVYPKYVPNSARAGVNLAVQDFLGAIFTYPGAMVGLPGKGTILRNTANALVGGGNEFTQVDQSGQLTPAQQHQSQVLKGNTGATSGSDASGVLTPPSNSVTTLAQQDITAPPRLSSSGSGGRKKKKKEYIPVPIDSYPRA